jgi:hypothetical protein
MKYYVRAFLLLLFYGFQNILYAQPDSSINYSNSMQLNLWGGLGLAYRISFTPHSSLRFLLEPSFDYTTDNRNGKDTSNYYTPSYSEYTTESKYKNLTISFTAEYIYTFSDANLFRPFVTVGPSVSVTSYKDEYNRSDGANSSSVGWYEKYENWDWRIGCQCGFGFESNISARFSAIVEYRMSAYRTWDSYERSQTTYSMVNGSVNKTDGKGWQLDLFNLRAGIGFYF